MSEPAVQRVVARSATKYIVYLAYRSDRLPAKAVQRVVEIAAVDRIAVRHVERRRFTRLDP